MDPIDLTIAFRDHGRLTLRREEVITEAEWRDTLALLDFDPALAEALLSGGGEDGAQALYDVSDVSVTRLPDGEPRSIQREALTEMLRLLFRRSPDDDRLASGLTDALSRLVAGGVSPVWDGAAA